MFADIENRHSKPFSESHFRNLSGMNKKFLEYLSFQQFYQPFCRGVEHKCLIQKTYLVRYGYQLSR